MSEHAAEAPSPSVAGTVSRRSTVLVTALMIALPALYGISLWLDQREAWLHPELLATSEYIWSAPNEGVVKRLRKALDWKAFDPNVNRVRPLNDLMETIDAVARPYITAVYGPHPSMTPIAVLTAASSPLFLFMYLRRAGLGLMPAAALTGLFISSTGFLSVVVAYIRPAKKITVLACCLGLYLAERHAMNHRRNSFLGLLSVLFLSFFADEMGLVQYPVLAMLFFPSLLGSVPRWKRVAFVTLPALFLISVAWLLPAIYAKFSMHGAWNALGDTKKIAVFGYLADPFFYEAARAHISRAVLTTAGIHTHVVVSEAVALILLIAWPIVTVIARFGTAPTRYRLAASAAAVVTAGLYATLLDWYPFPEEISHLGSFTYYYHSPLTILVIVWLAFSWQVLVEAYGARVNVRRIGIAVASMACASMIVANFVMFHHVNRLVQIIHTYPFATEDLFDQLHAISTTLPDMRARGGNNAVTVEFVRTRERLTAEYERHLVWVFGDRWQDNNFYRLFQQFRITPITKDETVSYLVRAYYPRSKFDIHIR